MEVVDAELVDAEPAVRCPLCPRTSSDAGMVGRRCGAGAPPCHGRLMPVRATTPGSAVATVATGHVIDRLPDQRAEAADERPLSVGAMRLVMKGIPENTRETYENQWKRFSAWCEAQNPKRIARPAAQSTMIEYLHTWESLPVHNRCAGGRQSGGEACPGHRPSPSTMWSWYSAVRFYHSMPEPPFPWHGGKRLGKAMKGYRDEMVTDLGWEPNKAPRAYPQDIMAMVDVLDLDDPQDVRDRAVILTNWYTAARASDLAMYRIGDVKITPNDIANLTLRKSKANKDVGLKTELRVLHPNPVAKYCAVLAVDAWITLLRDRWAVKQGALFRPLTKPGKVSGERALLRGARDTPAYKMSSVSMSEIIAVRAIEAGIPDGEYFTCHSLRRGRASHLREKGYDRLSIARSFGWADNGSINTYMEEAEATSPESPTAGGLLG